MTTADAAQRIGVSQRQVQRLISNGRVKPTGRVGRTWVVDPSDVVDLTRAPHRPGRPWDAQTAWVALWQLSGLDTGWACEQTQRRVKQRLSTMGVDQLMWACRKRAEVRRFRVSESFLPSIERQLRLSGVSAVNMEQDLMTARLGTLEGYCTSEESTRLVKEFFLVEDKKGNLLLRVTDEPAVSSWHGMMPSAVVGLDLSESRDPREQASGRRRIEGLLQ